MSTLENLYHMNIHILNTKKEKRIAYLKHKVEKARKRRELILSRNASKDDVQSDEDELDEDELDEDVLDEDNLDDILINDDIDSDSSDSESEEDNIENMVILPSFMNWYTCGYEHILKSINGKMYVMDKSIIQSDIIKIMSNVKNVYFLRRIPSVIIENRFLPCFDNVNIILIPGTDGFATFDFNVTEIICVNERIYTWATTVFEDTVTIHKQYPKNNRIIMSPRTFTNNQVMFLHVMDSFVSQTDVVLNAWLDKRIKGFDTHPQLLILAEFSQFYQIFQIFRNQLVQVYNAQTPFIQFKEFFQVKNRNIFISFHNYSYEELDLISKSVAFMVQPGSSEVKKMARKWKCGLIAQDNNNGFELVHNFIDYNLIFRRKRLELYVNEGDQQFPNKYTSHQKLLIKVRQALKYINSTKLKN